MFIEREPLLMIRVYIVRDIWMIFHKGGCPYIFKVDLIVIKFN